MLISDEYRKEQELLHKNPGYGVASIEFAPMVSEIINNSGVSELLDYGAGKGNLAKNLKVNHNVSVTHYDPGIAKWSDDPDSHQMVCCIDVLEHIEPELLDDVLDHLCSKVEFVGFFTIHTGPAVKFLSDGRNAHLIQQPASWWLPKIMSRMELINFHLNSNGFFCTVRPYD
jgi:hypothetical protein